MDPRVIQFLYINGFVVALLILYLVWRPKSQPSRLKLKDSATQGKREEVKVIAKPASPVRQLNVIFQFNGHEFEAYEVLGLAPGSSLEAVEKSYLKLMSEEGSDSHDFYKMAYAAIKKVNT